MNRGGFMMDHEKVSLNAGEFRWYRMYLPVPMGCAIITTLDEQERVNAAPFAMVFPWQNDLKEPQLIVMSFKGWDTSQNIKKTGQFVINWPEAHLHEAIMKTAVRYNEGVSELAEAGLHPIPAAKVKPPRIAECAGHYECTLNRIIELGADYHIIGDVVDVSLNKEYAEMSSEERAEKIKLPIAFGAPEGQKKYMLGLPGKIIKEEWKHKE